MEANNVAMREVLELFAHMNDDGYYNRSAQICNIVAKAKQALSVPPRNCDVGTAEEQAARFVHYCGHHRMCDECKKCYELGDILDLTPDEHEKCVLKWGQMPYEEGDDSGDK